MKKNIVLLGFMLSVMFSTQALAQNIAYVDLQRVIDKSGYAERVKADIKKEVESLSNEISSMRQGVTQLQQKAQKDALTMTQSQRENLEKELRRKAYELRLKEQIVQEELQIEDKRAILKIQKKALAELNKIAKEGGYDLVLGRDNVLYATEAIDITDQLINALK